MHHIARRGVRRPALERWLGVVLQEELDLLRDCCAEQLARDHQAEIDSGGHASAGDPVAIDHHALLDGNRAEERQQFEREPVRRGAVTAQQSRRAEQQRAGADGRHIAGTDALDAEELE